MSLEKIFRLSVIVNMIDRITPPAARISQSLREGASRIDDWNKKIRLATQAGRGYLTSGIAVTTGMLTLGKSTFESSKALGELSSLGIKDLAVLERAGKNFSDTWAGTTKSQFIAAAYDIKSAMGASLTPKSARGVF